MEGDTGALSPAQGDHLLCCPGRVSTACWLECDTTLETGTVVIQVWITSKTELKEQDLQS